MEWSMQSSCLRRRICAWGMIAALVVGTLGGCGKEKPPAGTTPGAGGSGVPVAKAPAAPLGPPRQIEAGVQVSEADLGPGTGGKVWVYTPAKPAEGPLPCVLIAPAGSPLIYGMGLADGDRAEHLPYVRAGFLVVAYALSGPVPENATDAQTVAGIREFMAADAGVGDARRALDYALAQVPRINRERIYTAGHSSAGTVSLLAAAADDRIKGCIAYAPCTNVPARLGAATAQLSGAVPGFREFVQRGSPLTHVKTLRCPVFLFHADDDTNVKVGETIAFVNELKKTNASVTLQRVAKGGHHQSMIDCGIPLAIDWLKKLPQAKSN